MRMRAFLWVLVALTVGCSGCYAYQLRQPKDEFVQAR